MRLCALTQAPRTGQAGAGRLAMAPGLWPGLCGGSQRMARGVGARNFFALQ